tara:strand:- start:317 stop:847 length:531 start_codon:yes stop_codon:yes gene_type:complete
MHIIKKNKFVKIVLFEKKYITQKFVNSLNSKSVNKYLDVRKLKQSIKSALIFYENIKKNEDYYLAILNNKNHLIGTITLRKVSKKRFNKFWYDNKLKWNNHIIYIGFMITIPKYFGTKFSRDSFQMGLNFAFNQLKAKMLLAGTDKRNASSNFNLMRNGFKMYKKTNKEFFFMLKR